MATGHGHSTFIHIMATNAFGHSTIFFYEINKQQCQHASVTVTVQQKALFPRSAVLKLAIALFKPWHRPCQRTHMIIIFAVATPTENRRKARTEIRTVRRTVRCIGSGFASGKLSDGHNHGPNDGHTEPRTQTRTVRRTVRRTVLPCEQGITGNLLAKSYRPHCCH
jgi:hypothetical protein